MKQSLPLLLAGIILTGCSEQTNNAPPSSNQEPHTLVMSNNYSVITPAVDTKSPITEFFWYGCGHCYKMDPIIHKYIESNGLTSDFALEAPVFNKNWVFHSRIFYTLKHMGWVKELHYPMFTAIQNKEVRNKSTINTFLSNHNKDNVEFWNMFDSDLVTQSIQNANDISAKSGIRGVPAFIVNGKYLTGPSFTKDYESVPPTISLLLSK